MQFFNIHSRTLRAISSISVLCMLKYNTSLAILILSQYFSNQQSLCIFLNVLKFIARFSTIRLYPYTDRVRNMWKFKLENRKERENSRDLSLVGNRNTLVLKEQDIKMWNKLNRLSVLSTVRMT